MGAHFFRYDLKCSNQVRNLGTGNLVTGHKDFTQLFSAFDFNIDWISESYCSCISLHGVLDRIRIFGLFEIILNRAHL